MKVLTIRQVAVLLQTSRNTLYRMIKRHEIPAFKVGADWRFSAEELEAWMLSHERDTIKPSGSDGNR